MDDANKLRENQYRDHGVLTIITLLMSDNLSAQDEVLMRIYSIRRILQVGHKSVY